MVRRRKIHFLATDLLAVDQASEAVGALHNHVPEQLLFRQRSKRYAELVFGRFTSIRILTNVVLVGTLGRCEVF